MADSVSAANDDAVRSSKSATLASILHALIERLHESAIVTGMAIAPRRPIARALEGHAQRNSHFRGVELVGVDVEPGCGVDDDGLGDIVAGGLSHGGPLAATILGAATRET